MTKPTSGHGGDIELTREPPADMHEDRLAKELERLESWICAALVLQHRAGVEFPADLVPAIENYGALWDESWNR